MGYDRIAGHALAEAGVMAAGPMSAKASVVALLFHTELTAEKKTFIRWLGRPVDSFNTGDILTNIHGWLGRVDVSLEGDCTSYIEV